MKTLRIILAVLALAVGVSTGRAQSFTAPMTGGGSGSVTTGSVTALVPLVLSGTEMQLPQTISQLNTNRAFTNANMVFSNTIVVNATANALTNGILLTNAVKYAGTLATGGRTILVHVTRGEYWTPTNTVPSVMMAVDNVSTYWEPGAKWYSGKVTAGSDTAHMWDDSAGKTTNVNIYGWGEFYLTNNSASVVSLEAGSTMTVECQEVFASESASAGSGGATTFNFLTLPATFTANVRGTIHSVTYDAIYFNASEGHKVNIKARKISSTFGDILEAGGSAANWGDVVIEADVMERTATTGATYLSTAYIPQPSMMKIGGNVIIRSGSVNCYSTNGCIYAGSETNYGLLANAVIKVAGNARRGVLDDGSATGTAHTGVWLKNCSLYGPTNLDVMNLTNQTTLPTILDNCTIYSGFGSTNWARGITPSSVVILGSLNLYPWKPVAANITILGTNNTPAIYNVGDFTQMGVSKFSNDVTVSASVFKLAGATTLDVDAEAFVGNFFVTNLFYLPFLHNGASVDGTGAMMQKSNAWATGRGTLMFNDQTADVKVVAALASDTPSNGQVPTWNTGGTITWETPSAGSGTTNPIVLAAVSLLSSNIALQGVQHLGTNNVQVWDASTSMIADVQMYGNTTLVFTNMGTFTNYAGTNWTGSHVARVRNVSGTLTVASPQPITFSSSFIATGKTNWLTIRYQNGAWHGSVSEVQTTGTEGSAYVLATAPTISGATITLASGSTNIIDTQTDDTPKGKWRLMAHDLDTASLKDIAINEFPGSSMGEVSVLDYGADRTGATDSTLAFQAAATNPAIYIPPGTYVITNVIVTNATIRGLVGKSIVRFNTNAVPYGFMFDTRSNMTHWRGITFDGGCTTNLRAFTTSDEARSGLKMYIAGDATVQNCTFINWHSNAVYVSGTNDITGRANHFRFQDNTITNCWTGLHLPSPNLAEYSIVTGNKIAWCNIGLRNDNANVTVAGNSIHDCAVGLTSYDTTAGRSHSRYTGNTFHHTKVSWQNALTGFGFVGNNMLGSTTVELLAPAFGGLFEGNYFEQFTVTDYSGGTNWFFGNQISGTISQGGTSTSIYDRNRYTTGIPVSEVSSLTYVTTNIHIHPMRANNFAVILTNNAGFTIGTGGDGQIIRLRLTQDGTGSRTVAWTNLFNFSTTYPAPTLSTGIGKTDWIEAQYWTASNRWDVIRTDIGH